MASYLVFTPPGGPDPDQFSTRFVKDGFSWLAFVAPWPWLLGHRLWLAGIGALILQLAAFRLMQISGLQPAGFMLLVAIAVIAGLEGRNLFAARLQSNGWQVEQIIGTASRKTAELIYFAHLPQPVASTTLPPAPWVSADGTTLSSSGRSGDMRGLFDHDGER